MNVKVKILGFIGLALAVVIAIMMTLSRPSPPQAQPHVEQEHLPPSQQQAKGDSPTPNVMTRQSPETGPVERGSIYGRVEVADGSPFAGEVSCTNEFGSRKAVTLSNGAYTADDLTLGRWWIAAIGSSYLPAHAEVILTPDTTRVERNLRLEKAPLITVNVETPDGTPWQRALNGALSNITATASTSRFPQDCDIPRSGNAVIGQYSLFKRTPNDPPNVLGRLKPNVPLPVIVAIVLNNRVLQQQSVGSSEVTFTIDGEDKALWASLTFKLVVPSGTGASASGVGLYDAQGGLIAPENTVSPAVSEAQFTYNHLVFGSYKIGGVIQGYGYYESYVYIDHQETDLGTIKLEEPFELKASIVGPDGRQRPQTELGDSTWVLVWRFDDSGRSHVSRSSRFEPESDGTFLLELSPGEYCIQAVGAWTSDIRRIIGGPEESQVVTLPTVRPATLVIQPGEYWNHIAVRVLNSVGEEEQRRSFAGPEPVRIATSSHSGTVSVVDWGGAVLGSVPYSMQEGTAIVRLEDIRSR